MSHFKHRKSNKKTISLLLFTFFSFFSFAVEYQIELSVKGFAQQRVLLAKVSGDMSIIIDTLYSNNQGVFSKTMNDKTPRGMYSFVFPQLRNTEIPFIFNYESVLLSTDISNPKNVQILQSKENQLYSQFLKEKQVFLANIDILEYAFDHYSHNRFTTKIEEEYKILVENFSLAHKNMLQESSGTFAFHLIRSLFPVVPPKILSAQAKNSFLQSNALQYIDFSDTLLLNSNVFTSACITYLGYYSNQHQTNKSQAVFIQAVDSIIAKTKLYPETYDFVTNYLINGFESMGAFEIVQYISSRYLQQNTCSDGDIKTTLQRKALSNTDLAIGKTIPKFSIELPSKQIISNKDLEKGYSVIIFWASWCGHCSEFVPEILSHYAKTQKPQYALYTVSLDTNTTQWQQSLIQFRGFEKSIHACDTGGWDGSMADIFNIYATPTIFIMKDGKIIARPIELEEYFRTLKKFNL